MTAKKNPSGKLKLCIIYGFAMHYRARIFTMIEQNFDCDWFFGDSMSDIKKMDYNLLNGPVKEQKKLRFGKSWYYQKGMVSLITKKYNAYIILSDTRSISGWLFVLLSKLYPKKKVYYWSHGWYGKESNLEKFIKKILYKLPNGGTFLYGNYARDLMIKEGFNPNKLFTIHNSLSYDRQLSIRQSLSESSILSDHFGNNYSNLIFTGRLTPVKKLDMIIKAISILKKKGDIYNLTIIGDGEMRDSLQRLVAELGLTENVWFFGACYDENELGNLLYNADLCVSPGNVGLTAMHALVFGCPVITHNNFAMQMPEFEAVKDGVTGTFFEFDSVDSLSINIEKWIKQNKGNRENTRSNCMEEIDKYWTPQFQIEVIKKILENENTPN